MNATIELNLKPALSLDALGKLLALSTSKKRPVESLIVEAVDRYVSQETPKERQLELQEVGA